MIYETNCGFSTNHPGMRFSSISVSLKSLVSFNSFGMKLPWKSDRWRCYATHQTVCIQLFWLLINSETLEISIAINQKRFSEIMNKWLCRWRLLCVFDNGWRLQHSEYQVCNRTLQLGIWFRCIDDFLFSSLSFSLVSYIFINRTDDNHNFIDR